MTRVTERPTQPEGESTSAPIAEARSVCKRFGSILALDNLSVSVRTGEFLGLLGPNGAGKSTLMNCFTGYLTPDSGQVLYHGKAFDPLDISARRRFGLAPQQIAVYNTLTARENLEIAGGLYGLANRTLKDRCDQLLEIVQLKDRAKERVKGFSGGMLRRLNIAMSLIHEPEILFCDEPTVGVDPQARNAIFELLERLNGEGVTIVYTTHYMEEVARMCTRIAIVDHGRIVAEGTQAQLLKILPDRERIIFPVTPKTETFSLVAKDFGALDRLGKDYYRLAPDRNFSAAAFFNAAEAHGLRAWDFEFAKGTLEDVFLHLTGRKLRE